MASGIAGRSKSCLWVPLPETWVSPKVLVGGASDPALAWVSAWACGMLDSFTGDVSSSITPALVSTRIILGACFWAGLADVLAPSPVKPGLETEADVCLRDGVSFSAEGCLAEDADVCLCEGASVSDLAMELPRELGAELCLADSTWAAL